MTTQPKDLMTLEKTIKSLETLRLHECGSSNRAVAALYDAAIHHLKAGRKGCACDAFQMAQQNGTDNEMYGKAVRFYDQEFHIGCDLPPISFCPWCGGKVVPIAQEVKETICPGCGKPSNHMESGTTSDHWGVWHGECEKEFWMAGTGLDDRVPPFSKRNVAVKEEPC